ncbi:MAG TPA: hypothetical protein VGF48_04035 [Thermoanaerobaculia bacterium]|jgi:hypothetical protein
MHPLKRDTPRGAQIGCSLFLALLLGGIGIGITYKAYAHPESDGNWIIWTVGAAFSIIGLLLLYAAIHQLFSVKSPVTEVSLEHKKLLRGRRTAVLIRQRGPMELESLRANLVGTRWIRRRKSTYSEDLGTFHFFDSGPATIDESIPLQRNTHIDVPEDIEPSEPNNTWAIEVWGKVRGRADFQHVFPVEVD